MRQSHPKIRYHAPEELTPELQKSVDNAFKILFEETIRRLSKEHGWRGVDVLVDSQEVARQCTFNA